jgi:hypothetical protein
MAHDEASGDLRALVGARALVAHGGYGDRQNEFVAFVVVFSLLLCIPNTLVDGGASS